MTIFSNSNGTMTLSTVMVIDGKNCMIRVSNPELFGSSDNYKASTKKREITIAIHGNSVFTLAETDTENYKNGLYRIIELCAFLHLLYCWHKIGLNLYQVKSDIISFVCVCMSWGERWCPKIKVVQNGMSYTLVLEFLKSDEITTSN